MAHDDLPPEAGHLDDTIVLGGQRLAVKDTAQGNIVSEFEAGLKVGPAQYDNREHAFFVSLDDFSGGFGTQHQDIRQEQGTFWDANPDNAVDWRRAHNVSLGPGRTEMLLIDPSTGESENPSRCEVDVKLPSYPYQIDQRADNGSVLFGIGNSIYHMDRNQSPLQVDEAGARAVMVTSIVQIPDPDIRFLATYAPEDSMGGSGTARYRISADGETWTNGEEDYEIDDAIWWDNKIVAAWGEKIIWASITSGTELWSVDLSEPEEPIFVPGGHIRFIGTGPSPAGGDDAVYFVTQYGLYWLDFFQRQYFKIDLGEQFLITAFCQWDGTFLCTNGWEVYSYLAGSQTLRPMGFPSRTTKPPSMVNSRITALIPAGPYVYAALVTEDKHHMVYETRLFCFNGVGWGQVGEKAASPVYANYGFIQDTSSRTYLGERGLFIPGITDNVPGEDDRQDSTDVRLQRWHLPLPGNTPELLAGATGTFAESGGSLVTGWMDGGFLDIHGTLLRLNCDALHLSPTETVRVEYQIDNDEHMDWVQLVNDNGVPDVFNQQDAVALWFNSHVPNQGIRFRTVRFRLILNRGNDSGLSPVFRGLNLVYLKTPAPRTTWTFQVDINRMIETKHDEAFYVDGEPATIANVWAKLKELWVNDHELVPLIIPGVEPEGIMVKIHSMPLTFDNFRSQIGGRGDLTLTVVAPVADEDIIEGQP